jgi:HAE1 family hydrophobic/amphiphilic exporter-1
MKIIGVILFLAVSLSWLSAQTNGPATRPLSLQDCFTEALKHNFDVQVEQLNPEISLYNLRSAYGGYDPIFSLSGEHRYNNSGSVFQNGQQVVGSEYNEQLYSSGLSGGTPWGMTYDLGGNVSRTTGINSLTNGISSGQVGALTLTQPLLKNFWIDDTRLTIRLNKNRLKFSEQGLREQIITTVTAVENAYYELIFARENVNVEQEALVLAQTQLDQDKQRVEVGSLAPLDVQQDQAQVAQSQANLIAAQNTLSVDQNALKNLLTDDYTAWHGVEIQPTATLTAQQQLFDVQDSWNKGMTERPDLLQARLNVEEQGIQLKFYRNQLFPEVDLIGSYGYNGAGQDFSDTFNQFAAADRPFYSYGAQLSMPLSNVGPRNQLKSGKVTEKQLLLQLKQLEQNVMVDIDNAVEAAKADWESVDATRQARTYAEAALDAEQKKYAVGKSTTFTVLQLQNNLTSARSQEIRALANYNQALANLAAAEGSSLQRDKLDLDAK